MSAPESVTQLVEKFHRDKERFKHPEYNEAQLRQEFVNPFFAALGWDVGDSKQVLHEAALRSGGSVKHPDYSFLAGHRRAFYVETKKPSINIGSSIEPAEQLRSYGWSGDTAVGILTNFAEFAVYDCRVEPRQGDSPEEARIMYLTSSQYLEEWQRLRETLSYEAVREGKHGDILETTAKGVLRVDEAFLRDMEVWRADLAEHLHKQARFIGRTLSQRELNHLVQRTIDRIVFLRIAEDRNLESYGRLERAVSVRRNVYNEIKQLYLAADKRYNSGLFHFDPADKARPNPDTLSLEIYIVDNVLRKIIADLYPPKSRYQFSVISADILGQVYERFLGKVIEVRSDGESTDVTVEEKPEVRKAGGVYYTPGYIVDYIVENTLGKLLAGKSPEQAAELRVLDPACGSGSFLVGAYQYLLDWHLNYYDAHYSQYRMRCRDSGAGLVLTTREKRRILLNNIYGVDLDQNAVEVSKLSLLLKMLEKENEATGRADMEEPILPDLSGNIKWGNSLIGSDFFPVDDLAEKDDEELLRVKPFDWDSKEGFGESMAAGGFDAVIGNPPYIRIQTMRETAPETVPYYKENYVSASKGNYDIYVLFIERGRHLLNTQGKLGYIVPSKFFSTDYGIALRGLLAEEQLIDQIVDFGHSQVFDSATTYTCLLFLSKTSETSFQYLSTEPQEITSDKQNSRVIKKSTLSAKSWMFLTEHEHNLLSKLSDNAEELLELPADMSRGSSSGADTVFCLKLEDGKFFTRQNEMVRIEAEMLRQPIYATDFDRYSFKPRNDERIIFPYEVSSSGYSLMDEDVIKARFPNTYSYLLSNKERLLKRKQFKGWYSFSAPRNLNQHDNAQILVPLLANKGLFSLYPDHANRYCLMASGGFSVSLLNKDDGLSTKYLLGLVNSRLLFWNLRQISNKFRGGWITCTKQYFGQLPIRTIDFDNPDDVRMHGDMVKLVDEMLDMHRQLAGASLVKRGVIEALIERTDREIDALVYRLYGLSEGEVAVVGG